MWKLKFHDKALYTKRQKEINEYNKDTKRRIKVLRWKIKGTKDLEEKEYIRNRINELVLSCKK